MLARVCSEAPGDIKSIHREWNNQMSNVSRLLQAVRAFLDGSSAPDAKVMHCPELKNMLWMKNIIHNCNIPDSPVVNCCAGTTPGAEACMLPPQNRQFVESNLNSYCVLRIPHNWPWSKFLKY